MFIPGTTPTIIIRLKASSIPMMASTIKYRMDFSQNGDVLVSKSGDGVSTGSEVRADATAGVIACTLTQAESYLFEKAKYKVQVHGLMNDGTAWKTIVEKESVGESLSDEVIA